MVQEGLPAAFEDSVETTWRPLAAEIALAARAGGPGFIVGLCGPQGSGKSTAAAVLRELLAEAGLSCAILSIDDLYLPREARLALAERVHPLLATRGPPGAHDVDLAHALFDALAADGVVHLPRFDKALDTRRAETDWEPVQAPVDVVLFEGWCVGARPQPEEDLVSPVNALEREADPSGVWRAYVNAQLAGPYRALFDRIGYFVLIEPPGFEVVLGWRREQERKLRERLSAAGQDQARAMSDAEVERFVAHYERLTRHILAEAPRRADRIVRLDAQRRPIPS
jgi:D-glycerate 3-kinase